MDLEDIASEATELVPTERTIASLVGKLYDPLGLLLPVVIRFKIVLQELSNARLDWDHPCKLLEKWSSSLREGKQTTLLLVWYQ